MREFCFQPNIFTYFSSFIRNKVLAGNLFPTQYIPKKKCQWELKQSKQNSTENKYIYKLYFTKHVFDGFLFFNFSPLIISFFFCCCTQVGVKKAYILVWQDILVLIFKNMSFSLRIAMCFFSFLPFFHSCSVHSNKFSTFLHNSCKDLFFFLQLRTTFHFSFHNHF